jgi:hemolysin activation/secretion protein
MGDGLVGYGLRGSTEQTRKVSVLSLLLFVTIILFGFAKQGISAGLDRPGFQPGREEELLLDKPLAPKSDMVLDIPEGDKAVGEQMEEIKLILTKVTLSGAEVFDNAIFAPFYQEQVGTEISLADVYRIAEKITKHYRDAGYILSRALIPAQTIDGGEINVRIVEGFIDKVTVEGIEKHLDGEKQSKLIHRYLKRLINVKPLHVADLERYLLLLNDLGGIKAKAIVRPSVKTPEASELVVKSEYDAVGGKVSVNNFNSKYQGPYQYKGRASAHSILGLGEQYDFYFIKGSSSYPWTDSALSFRQLSMRFPIGTDGFGLKIEGKSGNSLAGEELEYLDILSKSRAARLVVDYPLIRSRQQNLFIEAGLEARKTSTFQLGVLTANDAIRKAHLKMSYDFADPLYGVSLISVGYYQGLNWGDVTEVGDLLSSREEADPRFSKFITEFSRFQGLPWNFSLLFSGMWQHADEPLLSEEEMVVGGRKFGRGYDQGSISGDRGVASSIELRFNQKWMTKEDYQLYTFFESGRIWNLDLENQGTNDETKGLDSSGFGIRASYQDLELLLEFANPQWGLPDEKGSPRSRVYFEVGYDF